MFSVVLVLSSMWATAALYFDVRNPLLGPLLAGFYDAAMVGIWWRWRNRVPGLLLWISSLALVVGWWLSIAPSNDRPWQQDVEKLPLATVDGNQVTIHNLRNFDYQTETQYVSRWDTRKVDLSALRGVDLFVTHWGAPLIAHMIVSFRFGVPGQDDQFVAMSIEARKTIGQEYSALRGLFRQYNLVYLVADERDVVRLRTNYRKDETVRLYHTLLNPTDSKALFLQYLHWMEEQRRQPQWYNALTANCSSSVTSYLASQNIGGFHRWDPRIVFNGLAEKLLYQQSDVATDRLSFEGLFQRAVINPRAKQLDQDPNFSLRLREGQPGF
ncbi:MAG: DUF4105 domain-containing protein [Bryobacteraceae bacterium]